MYRDSKGKKIVKKKLQLVFFMKAERSMEWVTMLERYRKKSYLLFSSKQSKPMYKFLDGGDY